MCYSTWKMREIDMPLPCPVCRAANDQGPTCRRCRADLSLLFALDAQRQARLAVAASAAAQGRLDSAARHADQADAIRHGADVCELQAAVALLRRDFEAAWNAYRRGRGMSDK